MAVLHWLLNYGWSFLWGAFGVACYHIGYRRGCKAERKIGFAVLDFVFAVVHEKAGRDVAVQVFKKAAGLFRSGAGKVN